MSKARLSTGFELLLDGELLAILEALYHEVTLKKELNVTFQEMMKEIEGLVEQMSDADRKRYLVESLFLNSVTYENEKLDAYVRRLTEEGGGDGDDEREGSA